MIIQCDKCATKFRLDDSRITPSGVKVRCTKCDNVFIVTPPPPPEEVQVEELFGVAPGDDRGARPAAPQAKTQTPKKKEEDKRLSFDFDSEVTREDIFKTPADDGAQDNGKGFGFDQGLPPEQKSAEGHKLSLDDLDFSFSEDRSNEKKDEDKWETSEEEDDPFSRAFDKPLSDEPLDNREDSGADLNAGTEKDDKTELDFNFGEFEAESPKPSAAWPDEDTEANEAEPEKPAVAAENVIPFSAAASAYAKDGKAGAPAKSGADEPAEEEEAFKTILSKTVERDEPISFEAPDEEEEEEEDLRAPHRASQPRMGLIIAALVVVLGGGLIYFTGVIDKLTHILMPPAEVKVVEIESIKGFYEENKNFGKLFVIDARIKNITDTPQEIKAASGVIYNDSGDKIAEKSVSPGRILAIDDVRNLQKEELERAFRDPSGGIIPAKGSVPVMVLFIEVPEGLSEFGLDIVR